MRGPRLLASLAIVFWGVSFVATKAALAEIGPVTLIFLRFAIAAAVLLTVVRELPPRHAWPSLALMGFVGVFIHQILISTVNWAVYSILGHGTIRTLGPRRATSGAMLFGAALLAPVFAVQKGWRQIPNLTLTGWSALLFLAICCSALGYLFWYGALERIEVSRVAALLYAEPLVTVTAAALLLGERVSGVVVAGGVLVLASVLVAQYAPRIAQTVEEA